jgi:hypothetical protein
LEERIVVTIDRAILNKKTGRAYPYVAYWFSEALGLRDRGIIRKLGLSLTYVALFVSIRDDLIDGRPILNDDSIASEHSLIALANWYYDKYLQVFKEIFAQGSPFWFLFIDCMNQWSIYETWILTHRTRHNFDPLSHSFLEKSSQYLYATTLPTLAAIAILTSNKLESIIKFAKNYCIGFKLADDLRDWRKDITKRNPIGSVVIYYAMKKFGKKKIDETELESLFLDEEFINSLYDAAIRHLMTAKVNGEVFRSSQIQKFIEIQIEGLEEQVEFHRQRRTDFTKLVNNIFSLNRRRLINSSD